MNFFTIALGAIAGLATALFLHLRRQMDKNVNYLNEEDFINGMRKGQLIDIRKKDAYNEGHINGSRNHPFHQLTRNYNKLRQDQPIYLVCHNGKMSRRASMVLTSKGFRVFALEGGIEAWTKPLKSKK